jgi:hypothetical protein
LAGLTAIGVRFALATTFVGQFSAVFAPLGSVLLRLVGGPIGLVISGLAFLAVKFAEVKDNVIQFGDQNTTLSEILSAVWRIITGIFSDFGDFVAGFFSDFEGYLKALIGVNDKTWESFKESLNSALGTVKDFVNAGIGAFVGLSSAIGVIMAQIVDKISMSLNHAVSLAVAAGNSIKAALGGDFSGGAFVSQLNVNQSENKARRQASEGAIGEAFRSGMKTDYVGNAAKEVGLYAESVSNVVKERKNAFVSTINDEIARGRGSKSTGKGSPEKRSTGGSKSIPDAPTGGSGKGKGGHSPGGKSGDVSDMSRFEADLTAQKLAFERKNLLQEFSKEQEKAYWDSVIANYKGDDKTLAELKKKSADLDLQILRETAKKKQDEDKKAKAEAKALAEEELSSKEAMDNTLVQMQEDDAQQQLAIGTITNAQLLAKQKDFENQRYQIALKALRDRTALLESDDTVGKAKALSKEKELGLKHAQDLKAINHKVALDNQSMFTSAFAPIKSAFGSTIQGILQGTTTLKQGMKNAFQSIVLSYTQSLANMAIDSAAHWLWELMGFGAKETTKGAIKATSEATQTGATIVGTQARVAAEGVAAAESKAVEASAATSKITTKAADAAAGAYDAMIGIPYVGPVIAPIAAAVAFAGVMAFGGMISSSAGGEWDVPNDRLNLVHKNETILPATIAAPMREFFANGGIGNVGLPEQATSNSNTGAGLAMTAASALATQQSLIQAQQQQKQASGGTVVINTKGGEFIHKDDLTKFLAKENRNFRTVK